MDHPVRQLPRTAGYVEETSKDSCALSYERTSGYGEETSTDSHAPSYERGST